MPAVTGQPTSVSVLAEDSTLTAFPSYEVRSSVATQVAVAILSIVPVVGEVVSATFMGLLRADENRRMSSGGEREGQYAAAFVRFSIEAGLLAAGAVGAAVAVQVAAVALAVLSLTYTLHILR